MEKEVLQIINAFPKVWLGCTEENMNSESRVLQNNEEFSRIRGMFFWKCGPTQDVQADGLNWHYQHGTALLFEIYWSDCAS